MTDFQSRLNQFRQGLQDQQNTYNSMATNMANIGRRVLPDKLAQHYDYMEKVGGMTTGVSATIHGGKKMVSRLQKYRANRLAKKNNLSDSSAPRPQQKGQVQKQTEESADTSGEQLSSETAQRTVTETDPLAKAKAPENPAELNSVGEEGRRAKEVAGEDEGDDVPFPEAPRKFTPRPEQQKLDPATQQEDVESMRNEQFVDKGQQKTPSTTQERGSGRTQADQENPFERTSGEDDPLNETTRSIGSGGKLEGEDSMEQGLNAFKGKSGQLGGSMEGDATDVVNTGIKDTIVAGVKRGVGKLIGEGAGEAVADAIPFLGEAVGLGMLIHGIVKAHKHEENAPPPKLSAPNVEPTEQAGGFSAQMLKGGSGAPSIV